ncbi:hypothetical protein PUN28_005891 [Cardiocondyla obscurior]|uniref:Uncharacterized protein n=1 Tax=Cardiocondyla obscurior TaxID=286306 RepID=A0AAW2G8B4_9HYME
MGILLRTEQPEDLDVVKVKLLPIINKRTAGRRIQQPTNILSQLTTNILRGGRGLGETSCSSGATLRIVAVTPLRGTSTG